MHSQSLLKELTHAQQVTQIVQDWVGVGASDCDWGPLLVTISVNSAALIKQETAKHLNRVQQLEEWGH